jgi:hypothetical protein
MLQIVLNENAYSFAQDSNDALNQILSIGLPRIHYMSADGLKHWILESMNLVEETLDWTYDGMQENEIAMLKKSNTKLKRRIATFRKGLDRELPRESMINFYTNMVMTCEGLATLTGFGICKTTTKKGRQKGKATMKLNPEKMSIYNVE